MKCFYEHRMHLLQSPSSVFLGVTSFVHEFPTGVSSAPLPGIWESQFSLKIGEELCVCLWGGGRCSASWSSLMAQPCLILLVSSVSPLKTSTVHSSFLNTYGKYVKIYSFKDRWEKPVFFYAGRFVLKAAGRISFSRKMVRTLAMVSPLFFNLLYVLFLRTWYIPQTTESALNIVVY